MHQKFISCTFMGAAPNMEDTFSCFCVAFVGIAGVIVLLCARCHSRLGLHWCIWSRYDSGITVEASEALLFYKAAASGLAAWSLHHSSCRMRALVHCTPLCRGAVA
jgi:hypothetical protein